MKRTTVKLAPETDRMMRHEAQRRGMTVSAWTREAIEAHLGVGAAHRAGLEAYIGSFSSGEPNLGSRVKDILLEEAEQFAETGKENRSS